MSRRLSIVVPAYNEEGALETTVHEIIAEADAGLDGYEIIIVDDGSRDQTGAVADRLARRYPTVSVIHQPANRGVGAAYAAGVARARHPYLTLVPGDNPFHRSGLRSLFAAVGSAELVVSYRSNMRTRPPIRRLLSACCTIAMHLVTGRPIRDAHSLYVFPTEAARRLAVSAGYAYHIEALSSLLRTCASYVEVPVRLNPGVDASSSVMRPRVIATLVWTMTRLLLRRLAARLGHAYTSPTRQRGKAPLLARRAGVHVPGQ
jgi:glycosyltransferase involved in cell wall biosynthesis